MIVAEVVRLGFRSGSVAELYSGIFRSRFHHVRFMTEGIGENHFASLADKIRSRVVAFAVFGLIQLFHKRNALRFHSLFHSVEEVLVVRGRFVVKTDQAHFKFFRCNGLEFVVFHFRAGRTGVVVVASSQRSRYAACHHRRKSQRYKFLHIIFSFAPRFPARLKNL